MLEARLTIRENASTLVYDPMIFGGFIEHFGRQIYGGLFDPGSPLSNESGFRLDVLEALRELKVPIVRWPGGCYVSGYHWENGVGKDRSPTDDMAWGVIEPNTFGTDEFVELCRLLDWEPYICNNAGNGTIKEMRDWLEYCNSEDGRFAELRKDAGNVIPHDIQIWSIGNENWGEWEIGYKPIEEWAPFVLEAAKAMKEVDPDVRLSAASMSTREWTVPLLKAAGSYLDFISIHGYWRSHLDDRDVSDYLPCIMQSGEPEVVIKETIASLEEAGYRGKIKIAFDEWNLRGWHHPGFPRKEVQDYGDPEVMKLVAAREQNLIASQYTMADALFSASFFNSCLRHADDVTMANISPLVNTRGPLFVHPTGVVKRTHFHALAMYANQLESRVVEADVTSDLLSHDSKSIPVLDSVVTVNDVGDSWSIALVNRHPTEKVSCSLVVEGKVLDGNYGATILRGDSADSYNDAEQPDRVTPEEVSVTCEGGVVALQPHSLTILRVINR